MTAVILFRFTVVSVTTLPAVLAVNPLVANGGISGGRMWEKINVLWLHYCFPRKEIKSLQSAAAWTASGELVGVEGSRLDHQLLRNFKKCQVNNVSVVLQTLLIYKQGWLY